MPSERTQRQIDRLLDEAEQAIAQRDWGLVRQHAQDVIDLDPDNADALNFLAAMERKGEVASASRAMVGDTPHGPAASPATSNPESFASGRYTVKRFLGEGGKKRVYLAHDTLLDRDVAFALIKTDGLDETGRDRIRREAQAMGRLGAHPHIVSVFDLGEEADGQPFIVTELMGGGDVEGVIEKAPEHRPALERSLEIGLQVCRGLEFAHSHGIVHRDLKPGNVWLTADGTAKLGDFGLAVALDRSRLTQAGMMVGTVSYMPPEQALGGEVTPRSDLYSLGAVLYELVTGRPPFVGDESVAIIGQHLNTPPVAPTWHRPDCPPGLEALILRLLEKDPSKRPASAGEAREALERIASRPSIPASLPEGEREEAADNPLYRRVFVGREQEIRQLQSAFDSGLSGKGALAMVIGEPGIGKTAVCEQLATYVTLRGGTTLTGHCYEEGSLSLPYLAFVEALRSYATSRPPDALRAELGSAASDVARIVSEVRERLSVEPRPPGDPEEDRWRLLQAVSGFLRNASAVQPLLLVLEDLHWADQGTLDLLQHLARNLQGARLLVVGTYRDIEVDRSHPLSATLAELRRGAEFGRVLLRGLGTPEVQRMLVAITGGEVLGSLAENIHRQTEGNPLFVQEVVRYLAEEGHLGHGGLTAATTTGMSIPEGLRDVIGKRLARLSPECNRVLAVAAVIGRDFGLETLHAVSELDEEQVVSALEEALHIGVLEEQSRPGVIRYRFAHAFFRQTLYEELIAPRRLRVHQQVAASLEAQYSNRLEEHASELAEHFAQSTDRDDLAKAVRYGELAAQRALAVYAYGEAARHLERALDVQEILDPGEKAKRCDLLLALAEALLPAGEPLRVVETVAPEALAWAEQIGDKQRASRSCQAALDAILRQRGGSGGTTPLYQHWAEEADRYAAPGSTDRVSADLAMGRVAYYRDRLQEAWELVQRALALARQLDDGEGLYRAGWLVTSAPGLPEHEQERHRIAEELFLRRRAGASSTTMGRFLWGCCAVFLTWGERERFEEASRQVREIAERTQDILLSMAALVHDSARLVLDGRLEEAVAASDTLRQQAEELGVPGVGSIQAFRSTFWALLHLGRAEQALAAMPEDLRTAVAEGRSMMYGSIVALCLGCLGRWTEAQGFLEQLRAWLRSARDDAGLNITARVHFLAVAVLAQDQELAVGLREGLAEVAALIVSDYPTCIARHLGAASALLGDREVAHRYYEQALEVAGRIRFRPEIALTHLEIAELMLGGDDDSQHTEALQHLDFAIAEFREMKMQPSLERALRHKEVLKA